MNWGTCYSGSNNIHFDFPPIMSDGRNFATWLPGDKVNQNLRKQNNITTNWQYRKYLQNNADSIIKYNQLSACNDCCSCPILHNASKESNPPFLYKSCLEKSQPYGYENSDLKSLYLNKYQLQCRLYTPVMTQDQLINGGYQNYN